MRKPSPLPVPFVEPHDPRDDDLAPELLAVVADVARQSPSAALRARLGERLARSNAESAPMSTTLVRRSSTQRLADGVRAVQLYAAGEAPPRPGEPLLARRIAIEPGGRWDGPASTHQREILVLEGELVFGSERLGPRDFLVLPAGHAAAPMASEEGVVFYLRESSLPARLGDQPLLVRDAEAGWPDFAPGIQRRVLWQRDGLAALLYCAAPGASVPDHGHGHDEECLMVQGELFLDDQLLRQGDYQLAPAGTGHRSTFTDTGAVLFAHGDLDLAFRA